MTPEEPSRRSERRRKANKRYNADQFAELELGSDEEYIKSPQHHDSGEDEDFDALVAEENAPDVDDVFDATPTEPSEGEIEENSADDAVNSHLSSPDTTARIAPRKRKRLNEPEQSQGENQRFHSRLTSIPASITAKDKMMIYLLGSGEDQGQRHLASMWLQAHRVSPLLRLADCDAYRPQSILRQYHHAVTTEPRTERIFR